MILKHSNWMQIPSKTPISIQIARKSLQILQLKFFKLFCNSAELKTRQNPLNSRYCKQSLKIYQ